MSKRTTADFSKHQLNISKYDKCSIYNLQISGSNYHRVTFTNCMGTMMVNGDWGNWIFTREFDPTKEKSVSTGYWCKNLERSQKHEDFSPEATKESLKEAIACIEDEPRISPEEREELTEYYESCIENVESDGDYYKMFAHSKMPENLDSIIFETEIHYWLLVVLDAFEEVISRIKNGSMHGIF